MSESLYRKLLSAISPRRSLSDLDLNLSREEIIRRSRILFIDDEKPALIDDLKASRFSVDHFADVNPKDSAWIEHPVHDLILLDFGDVGKGFGAEQGLSLLRHLKRINPSIIVLAYTSKSLYSDHADFYRLADGVLSKDAGIQESSEKIEDGLRQAHSLDNLWKALIGLTGITPGSDQDKDLQHRYVTGLSKKRRLDKFKASITTMLPSDQLLQSVGQGLLSKLLELGMKAIG